MYKKLKKVMNKYQITQKELSEILGMNQSQISKRLNTKTKFDKESMKKIYKYIQKVSSNQYTDTIENLFYYELQKEKKEKNIKPNSQFQTTLLKCLEMEKQAENRTYIQIANEIGVDYRTFLRWVHGKNTPKSFETIQKISIVFNVAPQCFYSSFLKNELYPNNWKTFLEIFDNSLLHNKWFNSNDLIVNIHNYVFKHYLLNSDKVDVDKVDLYLKEKNIILNRILERFFGCMQGALYSTLVCNIDTHFNIDTFTDQSKLVEEIQKELIDLTSNEKKITEAITPVINIIQDELNKE